MTISSSAEAEVATLDVVSLVPLVPLGSIAVDGAPLSIARSLREWMVDPELLRPPRIILPHVAVEGRVTLLSGREKIGKSTFVGAVVAAASRGESVLGAPPNAPVSTLWYAIDEPASDAVRRWQYRPYVVNGRPTDVATIVTVNFRRR